MKSSALRLKSVLFIFMLIFFIGGCGKDEELESYRSEMESFYERIAKIDSEINAIEPETDIDGASLLLLLDELNETTKEMAELDVPDRFSSIESLALEASENMNEAVELYHRFYESEEINEELSSGAYEYYERANLRIRYITDILHGEIPEEMVYIEE